MPTYKYKGEGGDYFPTIGWLPKTGDTITVDEPIYSPLVEEVVTASTKQTTTKAEVTE